MATPLTLQSLFRPESVEDYDRLIPILEAAVQGWKRARKKLRAKARMKQRFQDPEFVARFRAGRAKLAADAARKARCNDKMRATIAAGPRALPPMTTAQINRMYRMRAAGVSREDAIKAVLSPSAGLPQPKVPAPPESHQLARGPMQPTLGSSGRTISGA